MSLRSESESGGFFQRLKSGLKRSSRALSEGLSDIFAGKALDEASLSALEELLIRADLGAGLASEMTRRVGEGRYLAELTAKEVREILADEITKVLGPAERALSIDPGARPFIVLVVGVNGSGKTTTIAKLAQRLMREGHKVVLGAGDTFRAAAIEQLKIWGERIGVPVIAKPQGADAAGVAFETVEAARATGADVVLIDTAGRLQNKANLMAELQKIIRVLKKQDPSAPHSVLLVLDATAGQNAIAQVNAFREIAGVTGLVMTKLDGTAKGGILVAIAERFGLPIHFIGVGESADDVAPFEARAFARALTGET